MVVLQNLLVAKVFKNGRKSSTGEVLVDIRLAAAAPCEAFDNNIFTCRDGFFGGGGGEGKIKGLGTSQQQQRCGSYKNKNNSNSN